MITEGRSHSLAQAYGPLTCTGRGALCALALLLQAGCGGNEQAAGEPRACPQAWVAANASQIESLCAKVVPGSGRLWFEGADGKPCSCGCPALLALDQADRDSLVVQRRKKDIQRYEQRAPHLKSPKALPAPKVKVLMSSADSLALDTTGLHAEPEMSTAPSTCSRGDHEIPFGDECVTITSIKNRFFAEFPVFQITYSDEKDPNWPVAADYDDAAVWAEGDPTIIASKRMTIYLPERFVESPNVGGELLAFLLSHELGHALSEGDRCTTDESNDWVCEGECDDWGATVAMRSVFTDEEYVDISEAAEEQMAAYYEEVYEGADLVTCGSPDCGCTNPSCYYPPLPCRLRTIAAARTTAARRPPCIRNWMDHNPASCDDCP